MKNHVFVLFVLVALFGAACSADVAEQITSPVETDTESRTVDEPESAVESAVEPAADDAPQATAVPEPVEAASVEEDEEPVAAVDTSSAASLLGSDDWCTAAGQIENILDPDDLTDPESLRESYGAATVMIAEAARIAPAAIAPDVGAMAQAVVAFSALLEEAEWNFLDVDLAAMEEVAIGMDVPGYNIEKYNFEVCGIGEDPGAAPDLSSDDFDEPLPQGSARDLMTESLVGSGFTGTEAACLVERLDFANPEVLADPSAITAAFGDCGISLDRLSQLGS